LPLQETWVQSLGQENPLEKEMATHSSILDYKPSTLLSMIYKELRKINILYVIFPSSFVFA